MGSLLVSALPLGSLPLPMVDSLPLGPLPSARFGWFGWEARSRRLAARRCLSTFAQCFFLLAYQTPRAPLSSVRVAYKVKALAEEVVTEMSAILPCLEKVSEREPRPPL